MRKVTKRDWVPPTQDAPPTMLLGPPKPQPTYVVETAVLTQEQEIRYLATNVTCQMSQGIARELLDDAGFPSDSGNVLDVADIVGAYIRDGAKPKAVNQFPDGELG